MHRPGDGVGSLKKDGIATSDISFLAMTRVLRGCGVAGRRGAGPYGGAAGPRPRPTIPIGGAEDGADIVTERMVA